MNITAKVDLDEFKKIGDYDHYVALSTKGFANLPFEVQIEIVKAFNSTKRGDWFYSITCGDFKAFIVENGEQGYTAMLPEEY